MTYVLEVIIELCKEGERGDVCGSGRSREAEVGNIRRAEFSLKRTQFSFRVTETIRLLTSICRSVERGKRVEDIVGAVCSERGERKVGTDVGVVVAIMGKKFFNIVTESRKCCIFVETRSHLKKE